MCHYPSFRSPKSSPTSKVALPCYTLGPREDEGLVETNLEWGKHTTSHRSNKPRTTGANKSNMRKIIFPIS